jgi:diguanylate cyclase (GGDEF)-like protein
MLAIVAFRLTAEFNVQRISRMIIARLGQASDSQHLKRRSDRLVFFGGAGWGMTTWPTQSASLDNPAVVIIFLTVLVAPLVSVVVFAPSSGTFNRWVAGWLAAIVAPALLVHGKSQILVALSCACFAYAMVWLSQRLHAQLRRLTALQFENGDLANELGDLNSALVHSLALAERNARCDSLTGLPNRRAFEEAVVKLRTDSGTIGHHLLLIDLDHFKTINDRFGHAAGDIVLASVSAAIEAQMRAGECCARWGGEEFVALLLDCDIDEALARVEKLRRQISELIVPGLPKAALPVTASIGIAPWKPQEPLERVVALADEAMYQAKHHGRNRAIYAGSIVGQRLGTAAA